MGTGNKFIGDVALNNMLGVNACPGENMFDVDPMGFVRKCPENPIAYDVTNIEKKTCSIVAYLIVVKVSVTVSHLCDILGGENMSNESEINNMQVLMRVSHLERNCPSKPKPKRGGNYIRHPLAVTALIEQNGQRSKTHL